MIAACAIVAFYAAHPESGVSMGWHYVSQGEARWIGTEEKILQIVHRGDSVQIDLVPERVIQWVRLRPGRCDPP